MPPCDKRLVDRQIANLFGRRRKNRRKRLHAPSRTRRPNGSADRTAPSLAPSHRRRPDTPSENVGSGAHDGMRDAIDQRQGSRDVIDAQRSVRAHRRRADHAVKQIVRERRLLKRHSPGELKSIAGMKSSRCRIVSTPNTRNMSRRERQSFARRAIASGAPRRRCLPKARSRAIRRSSDGSTRESSI